MALASPPPGYRKKLIVPGGSTPLSRTYTRLQIETRVAFYQELNTRRAATARDGAGGKYRKRYALYGWEDTTTVRVYMRETVGRIAAQLFSRGYVLRVVNVNRVDAAGNRDKDHGHVEIFVEGWSMDVENLLGYVRSGASYFVYDGEADMYVPSDTEASEFIITRPEDPVHPAQFWRRSQSFVFRCAELNLDENPGDG